MSKINLLPWRVELRKQKLQEFLQVLALVAVVGVGVIGLIHYYYVKLNDYHQQRNQFIVNETKKLDKKIAQIKELEKKKQQLLDRMRAIEQLQGNRPLIVRFFDALIKTLPEGVTVDSITQTGKNITLTGEAQSYARVASFMRNLEASPWLTKPSIDEIQGANVAGLRISKFTLHFSQVIPKSGDDEGDNK